MEGAKLLLTSLFSVLALFIITKIMGHKQVGQLSFFDYISGITIGSIAAELATNLEKPWKPFLALVVYGVVSLILSVLSQKSLKARKYANGAPAILLFSDKLYEENFRKAKLDLSEFLLLCRQKGYFDLNEIELALFENNGTLSVLPKAFARPATTGDLSLAVPQSHIGVEVIMDKRILGENLHRIGKDEKWLVKKVKSQGYSKIEEVFFGVYYPEKDSLSLYRKNKK